MRRSPGLQINRNNIAIVSSKAYNKAVTPDNLISSFRKTGIFPLERKQISSVKTAPSGIYQNLDTEIQFSSQLDTTTTNLLEQKKINTITVNENQRKRKLQPSVHGNLMSPSKMSLLKRPALKCENYKKNKLNKKTPQVEMSPKPSTSGLNTVTKDGIPIDTSDSSSDEYLDESELCCVCKRFSPDTFSNAYTVEFIKWGQCDGWVHLKYCTPVKFLRRETAFLCPNSEKKKSN